MLSIPVILLVEEFLQGMKGGLLFRSVGGLKGGSDACEAEENLVELCVIHGRFGGFCLKEGTNFGIVSE